MTTTEQPSLFDDDQLVVDVGETIPARHSDPETSHAATAAISIRAGSQRCYLLLAFAAVADSTDEEAMMRSRHVRPTSEYAKRCSELRDAGLIEPTGQTRAGDAGHQRIVCRITAAGSAALTQEAYREQA